MPKLVGTGVIIFYEDGRIKEELIKYYRDIGYAGKYVLEGTNVMSIRYSGTGIHATPIHPNRYNDAVKEKLNK